MDISTMGDTQYMCKSDFTNKSIKRSTKRGNRVTMKKYQRYLKQLAVSS